jgi:hypothetical protein
VPAERWTPAVYTTLDGTAPYLRFRDSLTDVGRAALDTAIEVVLAARGIDLAGTEWLKALGSGLHEFRIRHTADEAARMFGAEAIPALRTSERVLQRVFVHFHGQRFILLIGGYDKGNDPNERRQQREIAAARRLLAEFQERERQARRDWRKGRR